MFMNEKGLPPSLDEALANVNPERRRFLGMMLAGAAALPLLTSTELAVGEGMGKKEEGVKAPGNKGCAAPQIPTFSPAAGTYSKSQTVTISDNPSCVNIFYTTDGSTPVDARNDLRVFAARSRRGSSVGRTSWMWVLWKFDQAAWFQSG